MNKMATVTPVMLVLVISGIMAMAFAVTPATNWTSGTSGNYVPANTSGFVAAGGNVTDVNIGTNMTTSKWAGIYGNISGSIVLARNSTVIFYTWTWTPLNGATVCATTSNTFSAISGTATAGNVDAAWFNSYSTDADTAAKTMTQNCTIQNVTGMNITGSDAVSTTDVGAGTQTCAAKQNSGTAKDSYVFCAPIIGAGFTFDGLLRNYALLLPTTYASTDTYYFYLQLQ